MKRADRGQRGSVLAVLLALLLLLVGATAVLLKFRYGGGAPFPDRSGPPLLPAERLQLVAELDWPPGNIAVSADSRIIFSLHPEARPPQQVVEWREGRLQPYPSAAFQADGTHPSRFHEVLSVRIDRQQRLWALDNGTHGLRPGRLLAFALDDGDRLVHEYSFPRTLAGLGSHLNDFQVSPDGATIYIADASFFAQTPALLVYDLDKGQARRVLEAHESVDAEHYLPVVQGRPMEALGLVAIRPGVDSIALDERGEWLYFAPVTNNHMYRVRTRDLRDETLSPEALRTRIERYALKTMSDGLAMDADDRIYISDLEHSAIVALDPDRRLTTLLRDDRLRWPDGFSFGPEGALYITCSALHQVIGRPPSSIREHAPYQIYKLGLGVAATPGH